VAPDFFNHEDWGTKHTKFDRWTTTRLAGVALDLREKLLAARTAWFG
jgi:hypothetical protein